MGIDDCGYGRGDGDTVSPQLKRFAQYLVEKEKMEALHGPVEEDWHMEDDQL